MSGIDRPERSTAEGPPAALREIAHPDEDESIEEAVDEDVDDVEAHVDGDLIGGQAIARLGLHEEVADRIEAGRVDVVVPERLQAERVHLVDAEGLHHPVR